MMSVALRQRALTVTFLRFPLLLVGALVTAGLLLSAGESWRAVFNPQVSVLYFVPINVLCWVILASLLRTEGTTMRRLAAFEPRRLPADIGWGIVWVVVLYLPFVAAVMGVMAVMHGGEMFDRFATVFASDTAAAPDFSRWFAWVAAIAAGVLFPLTNAPVEEMFYRGYAQSRLDRTTSSAWLPLLIPTIGFAAQHLWLAPTVEAVPVFICAFFVWGFGAALIRRWQGRLMPLIIAHLLTNLAFGIVPLMILLLGVT